MTNKLKHLELIQGVVNRLATASFQVKGWCVVLVSAVLVVGSRAGSFELGLVSLVPVLAFWGLDGYFLSQERLFRALYNVVRREPEEKIDFSMNVRALRSTERPWSGDWCSATRSSTLLCFYGMLALLVTLTALILRGME